ncbi:hypothetical protein SUGI_0093800 [Cryptomeria japonica]|nr:hypothetical protein SUGI_0093800 [Cryptomeria japonica]
MSTGKPPWGSNLHPFTAMYRIGFSAELPEMPQHLSAEGKDFLEKCLRRDPRQRWSCEQLLAHPFVSEDSPVLKESPLSCPQGTLDLEESDSCSSIDSYGSPIWALLRNFSINRESNEGVSDGDERMACQKSSSPKDRILKLAAGGEIKGVVGKGNNWFADPLPDQWIVVRSPVQLKSFNSVEPFQMLFPKEVPSTQAEEDCTSITESSDYTESETYRSFSGREVARTEYAVCKVEHANYLHKDIYETMDVSDSGPWKTEQSCPKALLSSGRNGDAEAEAADFARVVEATVYDHAKLTDKVVPFKPADMGKQHRDHATKLESFLLFSTEEVSNAASGNTTKLLPRAYSLPASVA